jgi:hypothetical protein
MSARNPLAAKLATTAGFGGSGLSASAVPAYHPCRRSHALRIRPLKGSMTGVTGNELVSRLSYFTKPQAWLHFTLWPALAADCALDKLSGRSLG